MPCLPIPPFAPPSVTLPAGFGIPAFTPPTITAGFCCSIQVPPWGSFPVPLPPFGNTLLAGVVAVLAEIDALESKLFDEVAVPCPIE